MFTYLLFDLDGTLTDPAVGITKSVQYVLKAQGINEPDLKKLEIFIGPPLRDSFRDLYGMTSAEAESAVIKYRERFAPIGIYENEIYPGIKELLEKCRAAGKKMAVASSKALNFVEIVLKHFDIHQYFDIIMGSEMDGTRGTKEEVIGETLRLFRLDRLPPAELAQQACMIGDRKYDIAGAKHFGLTAIGVTYGYGSKKELEEAGTDYLTDSVSQLSDLLL
jgi:phosphoglycolate phosphatase